MRPLFIALVLFACHGVVIAQDADSADSRRAQAQRYIEVSNIDKMMADMTTAMTQNLAPAQAEEVKHLITRHVRMDVLKEAMIIVMVKHFTTRELAAMADFYGSPEGRSEKAGKPGA